MLKKIIVLLISTIAAISLTVFALAVNPNEAATVPKTTPTSAEISESFDAEAMTYFVKSHKGYIAIFLESNQNEPLEVTDINVTSLRLVDQETLEKGVTVVGEENLVLFLEDFAH